MTAGLVAPVVLASAERRIDILIRILLDPLVLALVLGGLMALFLFSLEVVTVAVAWVRSRRERREADVRPAVRAALFDRLVADDPAWAAWAADLDETETRVARELVDTYLRVVRGREHERLQDAGDALGIADEAVDRIESGDRAEQLQALTWLTVLDREVDADVLWEYCRDDPMVRASAARLISTTHEDDAPALGTRLLLADPAEPLTSFGLDTLYELHREDPAGLVEYAAESAEAWSAPVTVQVLRVLREYTALDRDVPTDWLVQLLDHDKPAVRAAATGVFEGFGWNETFRDLLPHDALAADPATEVRRAYCRVLASWNDDEALSRLREIARSDDDTRVRLVATRGLPDEMLAAPVDSDRENVPQEDPVQAWVRAERAIRPGGVGT